MTISVAHGGWSALEALEALHWLISGFEYHLVSLVVSYKLY